MFPADGDPNLIPRGTGCSRRGRRREVVSEGSSFMAREAIALRSPGVSLFVFCRPPRAGQPAATCRDNNPLRSVWPLHARFTRMPCTPVKREQRDTHTRNDMCISFFLYVTFSLIYQPCRSHSHSRGKPRQET